jgi:hypothetical protein
MIGTGAWAQAAFAANAPAVASTVFVQLATIGFEAMRNARAQRTLSELDIERAARCADAKRPFVILTGEAPRYPKAGVQRW